MLLPKTDTLIESKRASGSAGASPSLFKPCNRFGSYN